MPGGSGVLVEARCIWKRYPGGVVANKCVSLTIRRGEVLGLLGENGAGKTTFVSILAGLVKPDKGEIIVKGQPVVFSSPRDAVRKGIVLVPQNPRLVDSFTVAENVMLALRLAGKAVSLGEARRIVHEVGERYGLRVDPDARVWRLSMGERQRAEIAKALALGAELLLLDEPTTHLSPKEAGALMKLSRSLAEESRSVVLITHRLREVLGVADRIAVMRHGELVGVVEASKASRELLLEMMFGERRTVHRLSRRRGPGSIPVLRVHNLWVRGEHKTYAVRGVSLEVREGEVVGIAGVAGNGQRELFEALVGIRRPEKGRIIVDDADVTKLGGAARGWLGVAVIPEDRLGWALVPGRSLVFNTALGLYSSPRGPYRGPLVDWGAARRLTQEIVEKMKVKTSGLDVPVESLSGGNMQRFILGREMAKKPRLILAMNPASGLDVAATESVHRLLLEAADNGAGLLVISEDLDELLEISDRILVINRGRIVYESSRPFEFRKIADAMAS